MNDYTDITERVKAIAVEAGEYIKKEAEKFNSDQIRTKGDNDFVSYVDLEAEKMIVKGLKELIPEAGFLTEEGTIRDQSKEYYWVVDPLDGTTNFMHGLPPYSVSIALKHNEDIVAGVIYEISSGELFHASSGSGAWLNDSRITVSSNRMLKDCLIGTGFPYKDYTYLDQYLKTFEYFIRNTRGVRRQGSAAVDLAHVACGRLDAFFEFNLNPWDVCAGTLLIREAGGIVSDFKGDFDNITGSQTVAGNNLVYLEFLEVIKLNLILE